MLCAIHTNLFVSEVTIYPLTENEVAQAKEPDGHNITKPNRRVEEGQIVIDGVKYFEHPKKIVVKRFKKDSVHVSVPVVSFLPLKSDDLFNQRF